MQDVQIDELYSIDTQSLRQLAPVYAVIFLFKYGPLDRAAAAKNEPIDGFYDREYQDKGIFFANQTIQNACATQAVINSLLNKTDVIQVGEELATIKLFTAGFDTEMSGDTISNSETIRTVHNSFSAPRFIDTSELPQPEVDSKNDGLFHFVTFLNLNNTIYELDGLQRFPIVHDKLDSPEDFYEKLPEVLQRRISKYSGEIRFSLLAVTNNKLTHFQNIGDAQGVEQELAKRETWSDENALRRHDFPRLTIELLKNISQEMDDDEWEKLLLLAKEAAMKRYLRLES